MEIVRKNYPEIPVTGSPHFHSVRAGNMLFLAGATAKMTDAEFGNIGEQTDVILKRIQHIMEAEGGTLDNVVKITNFVTDVSAEAKKQTQEIRVRYFGENLPASTRVQVAGLDLPHLKIEIEAIAVFRE
ncbi:MAG: hypothetical protein BZY79_02245 [SAR202 cluster bacterium Casp-Chloro-G4]|nr:RidA family protein [Chloroflexota bacterium]MDA1228454.1 RidA family protein [Chloroflexota bacterium]PKB61751.1 MAG: hypothetical protein BZY79_02245 [SAR202 cluster bacterium Casp-Chloro-G4]